MFKRPRLSRPTTIVNVALATSLIFLAACGDPKSEETPAEPEIALPAEPIPGIDSYKVQAVWATRAVDAPITDLAFIGGSDPLIGAVLSSGELQIFSVQGDRITETVDLDITAIATGQAVVLDGAAISLFPGIGQSGDVNLYAYAPALEMPVKIDIDSEANAAGICAGAPLDDTALMQIAYWTEEAPTVLVQGHIVQAENGDPAFAALGTHSSGDDPITACTIDTDIKLATRRIGHTMATLEKFGQKFTLALTSSNLLSATNASGDIKRVDIAEGLTVKVPSPPTAMAALSNVEFGNYPDGLIILAGPVGGAHQITLIEPGGLFRDNN